MAVAVALLMIGGEFDLSAGAMIGTTGLTTGILMTEYDLNVWVAILASLVLALAIGVLNGVAGDADRAAELHRHARHVLRAAGRQPGRHQDPHRPGLGRRLQDAPGYTDGQQIFGSFVKFDMAGAVAEARLRPPTLYAATFWWIAVTIVATWVLLRTRAGNWIFAVGGAQQSARQVGVPVFKTKVGLFMTTAFAGWLVGMLALFKTTTVQSITGVGQEFIFIICAVVGGCLLTGGYGSAVGAALGALIYGMVQQGIVYDGLGQRLALRLPRRDAARRRPRQQLGQDTSGDSAMTTNDSRPRAPTRHRSGSDVHGTRRRPDAAGAGTRSSRSRTSASPTAASSRCAT